MYGKWMQSPPFDIGMTTKETLRHCATGDPAKAYHAAKNGGYASNSESNGSLMRITPMAVWVHRLPYTSVHSAVQADVRFTHGLPSVTNLITAYTCAIKYLLNHADDTDRRKGAFKAAEESVERCGDE